jgi:signal transduction histidine kinase
MLCTVIRNANRLSRLTEDILDVTKIESQTLRLKKERFDIEDIIVNTILEFKEETKNVDPGNRRREILYEPLSSKFKDMSVNVDADKSRISQVLSNLISNAIKFTDESGIINIKLDILSNQVPSGFNNTRESNEEIKKERERGSIVIAVADNGSGIDPEVFSKLFIKFVSKSFHGTGLGLFISKSIVEAHGGKIWAKNNINGSGGATFSFTIPIAEIGKNFHSSCQRQEFQLEDQRKQI